MANTRRFDATLYTIAALHGKRVFTLFYSRNMDEAFAYRISGCADARRRPGKIKIFSRAVDECPPFTGANHMGWDVNIPDPADRHVGARVRRRRKSLQMSREQLGAHVSLTLQQIQKHELGIERIGAVKLFQIARVLQAPLAYFFDGYAAGGKIVRTVDGIGFLPRIRGENLRCRITERADAHTQD